MDRHGGRLQELSDAIGRQTAGLTAREVDGISKSLGMSRRLTRELCKELQATGRVLWRDGRLFTAEAAQSRDQQKKAWDKRTIDFLCSLTYKPGGGPALPSGWKGTAA